MKKSLSFFIPDSSKTAKFPFYLSPIHAGFPSPAEDYLEQKLDLHELLIEHPAATFFVRVEGDSMQEANIYKGDILIVDRAKSPQDKTIVVAVLDGEFTVKRIRLKNKQVYLEAENLSYPPIKISKESDFQIWGVVTYIIHKAL
jgi:DNA polymerase V